MVLICDGQGKPVVQVGLAISAQACQAVKGNKVYQELEESLISGWLLASQPVLDRSENIVVVGQALDSDFSGQLRQQVEQEHLLLFNGALLGGSFPDDSLIWDELTSGQSRLVVSQESDRSTEEVNLAGTDYFAIRSTYEQTGLETIVLLPGTSIAETQQRLTRTAVGGILIVSIICSLLAVFFTQRISRPLENLKDSAIAFRMGDLTSPVMTNTRIREVAEVSYALEDARIALRHTLEELRREKAWGDYLLESVVEGIITLDRQDRITFFSPAAERITAWRQEQVLGKSIDDVFRLADREKLFSQRIPAAGAKQEIVTILVDERPLTLAVNRARLAPPDAVRANIAFSIRDISNEEAMRGLLGDFLSNITHEFRTPLTALAVSIELLLDKLPELSQDELQELLVSNHLGVLSLQNLIDNLLEGASIEAGRFQVSPRFTDLAEVIHEVVRVMQPLMEKRRHSLQMDIPTDLPPVLADPRRTSQVLVNLLSNAIKWSPQGSVISLSALAGGGEVRVSVADQGPGILAEHKQDLFARFGHLRSNEGRAEYGAGLGLSVVKAIVESQRGQVGVEDRLGGGAVFWFTIPLVDLSTVEEDDL
jgi:PAS domain S-box-containing protein